MSTIYVVQSGDSSHGWGVFGATTDPERVEPMYEAAGRFYLRCYGGTNVRDHVRVTEHIDGEQG